MCVCVSCGVVAHIPVVITSASSALDEGNLFVGRRAFDVVEIAKRGRKEREH